MKIRLERGGAVFEYEHRPMSKRRFLALCALAAVGVYAGMVIAVAALCGLFGVLLVGVVTLFGIVAVLA